MGEPLVLTTQAGTLYAALVAAAVVVEVGTSLSSGAL